MRLGSYSGRAPAKTAAFVSGRGVRYRAAVLIATYNVNSLGARLEFVLQWLRARQPDVVCVQELKLEDKAFPHAALEGDGYAAFTHGQSAWNGVAVLVRKAAFDATPEVVQRGLPGQDDFGARLVSVRIGELLATSVYIPNGKTVAHADFPRKLGFLESLAAHLEATHAGHAGPAIVGGDFNLCPGDLDTWDPAGHVGHLFHTTEERSRFDAILGRGRLHDLFRRVSPEEQTFTWWDYRAGHFHKKMGLRIDFVLGNETVAARTTSVVVDREWRKKKGELVPSDHAPVVAEVGL